MLKEITNLKGDFFLVAVSMNVTEEDGPDLWENEVIITSNGDKILQTFETSKCYFQWTICVKYYCGLR